MGLEVAFSTVTTFCWILKQKATPRYSISLLSNGCCEQISGCSERFDLEFYKKGQQF
jgi:hypothetical protein